ncbi:MAG: hypothetical protein FJY73_11785 [Candidatus Eisenbacteria bacterium]|nr:hypothetical protein [Candidatus Eisenbacteria bacterium]
MNRLVDLFRKLDEIEGKRIPRDEREARVRAIEKEIDNERLLRLYRDKKTRTGSGLAPIKDGVCLMCGMHYPETHQLIHRIETEVMCCEFCGRIAFVAPPDYRLPERRGIRKPLPEKAPETPPDPALKSVAVPSEPLRQEARPPARKAREGTSNGRRLKSVGRGARKRKPRAQKKKGPVKDAGGTRARTAGASGRAKRLNKKKAPVGRKKARKKPATLSRPSRKRTGRRS